MAGFLSRIFSVAAAALLTLVIYRVYRAAADPLRSIPGPFLARFSRLWYTAALAKGNFEIQNIRLHRKYGSVFRVSPGVYSIDDPIAATIIYNVNKVFRKSRWYYAAGLPDETKVNAFATDNEKINAECRRKLGPTLSQYITYEPHCNTCLQLLLQKLRQISAASPVIDLGWWLTCYAFDVSGMITFSKRFGHLDKGEDVGKVSQSLSQRLAYATHVGVYPEIHPYTFALVNALATATGEVDYTLKFTLQNIEEYNKKMEKPTGPIDMLTRYSEAHKLRPDWFTDYDVLMGCFTNIVAGADTTWIALNGIFYNLLKYPKVLGKLRSEIDENVARGKVSTPITYQEAQQLPYLQATIKEGQRLWPSTGLPLWRIVPESGVTLCGRYFPPGTTVGINTWVACRNAEVFAPDPDAFRPERWLEANSKELEHMDRYYIPFGIGPRSCQGKNVALLEINKVVPELVRSFDMELDDSLKGGKEWKSTNNWLVGQEGFKVKMTPRGGKR